MPNSDSKGVTDVRIGVIGCGQLGASVHLPALARLAGRGARVTAIAEADPARLRIARALAPQAEAFADWRELLDRADLAGVIVALPNALHAEAAMAAIQRGRGVYLEKPLACSVADAEPVVEAWRAAKVVGMMGFNYRFNPLYQTMRRVVQSGRLGQIVAVRSVFTTAGRDLPHWKHSRATGGGVLLDLASHHLDLLRWLFEDEIAEIGANVRSVRSDEDTATVQLRLAGGVLADSFFSLASGNQDRWEIHGTDAVLRVDRYHSLDVEITPAGGEFSLPRRWLRQAGALAGVGYAWRKRRSVAHEPSFELALEHFVHALQGGVFSGPSLEDGLRSLAAIEAAERAASTGQVQKLPSSVARIEAQPIQIDDDAPALSVILATPDTYATIRATVHHLRRQTAADRLELVIVAPSATALGQDEAELSEFWGHQVVETGRVQDVAHANAAGIRRARASLVVLAEDHAFPEPGWAEALIARHRDPRGQWAAVGPVLCNGNPSTLTSWADFLIAYGPWAEGSAGGPAEHLPGHNSSYKKQILLDCGDRLEQMLEAESVLHWQLRAAGQKLYLEPKARVAHLNFALLSSWCPTQFYAGRLFGASRAQSWPAARRLAFAGGSVLIPLVRLWRVARQSLSRGQAAILLRTLPVLVLGLALDGLGQMCGYALGAGHAKQKLTKMEYHRVRHLKKQDQQAIAELAAHG